MRLDYLSMWSVLLITVLFTLNVHSDDDYNYARNKTTSQFEPKLGYPSSRATDGDLTKFSSTSRGTNYWWLVNLGNHILFRSVKVFVRNGSNCQGDEVVNSLCSTRLREVYFLTNPTDDGVQPNKYDNDSWNICSYSETPLGDEYTRSCGMGLANPLTRRFSIFSTANTIIELREVEVYGYELPQLSTDIDISADQVTSHSITISFQQWTQNMIGGLPPTGYGIEVSDSGGTQSVNHNQSFLRLSVMFKGLVVGTPYTFTVSCYIQGVRCPGESYSKRISTVCNVFPTMPGMITLTSAEVENDGRQRWEYTALWEAPDKASCEGTLRYRYRVNNGINSPMQKKRTAVFYLDGDEEFQFSVKAVNYRAGSGYRSTSDRSGVLNPQFISNQPTLTATSASCVNLSLTEPDYPGGNITQNQYRCDGGEWRDAALLTSVSQCEYQPYTLVQCQLRSENSAGWGSSEIATATTQCAEPSSPSFLVNSTGVSISRTVIEISLEESVPNCKSLKNYTILISDREGQQLYSVTNATAGNITVEGALPFTTYSIVITAINDADLKSQEEKNLTTVETKAPEEPKVLLLSNTNCVGVRLEKPDVPNGLITSYKVSCSYTESLPMTKEVKAEESTYLEYCSIPSATLVECTSSAINSVGQGEESFDRIYTQLKNEYLLLTTVSITASAPKEGFSVGVVVGSAVGGASFTFLILLFVMSCLRYQSQKVPRKGEHEKSTMKIQSLSTPNKNSEEGVTEEPTAYECADARPVYEEIKRVSADHVYCDAQDNLFSNDKPSQSTSQYANGEPAYEMVEGNSADHVYNVAQEEHAVNVE